MLRGQRDPADRWTEHDTSTAIALTIWEDGLCSGCGHPLADSASELADPNHPERTHHYDAPYPVRCHACTAVEHRTKEYSEAVAADALRFRAVRVDDTDDAPTDDPDPGPAG